MLKTILCAQHFCSFDAMLFILNLLIKRILLLSALPECLSMFVISYFPSKIAYLEDMLIG